MTPKEAAAAMDGNEYLNEGTPELFARMKEAGLVAVFGASDDLVEFRGAINDEAGTGATPIDGTGIITSKCDCYDCPYFEGIVEGAQTIEPEWAPDDEPALSWRYKTDIPHETFMILEDGEPFCRGIVFRLADVKVL